MEGGRGLAKGIPARLSSKELRRFGFTLAIPLALLTGIGVWRQHTVPPILLGALAAALTGFSLLAPGLLRPVHRRWMEVAHALGSFNTRLLLSVVYFLVITPTGAVMRILGRDPMARGLRDQPSYWIDHETHADPRGSMERQF